MAPNGIRLSGLKRNGPGRVGFGVLIRTESGLHVPSRRNATTLDTSRSALQKHNIMKKPSRYRQERDFLLYLARTAPEPKGRTTPGITEADYAAVYTSPANNQAPTYGPCLIWRRGLTTGGYGLTSHNGRQVLAHRLAYEITRGSIPNNLQILHMCNRRSCIQPAHLYAGTPQENAEDRKAKTQNWFMTESMFEKHNRQVAECSKYVWPEPSHTQLSHRSQPEHECSFVVPAGIGWLCETCYQPMRGTSLWWGLREIQGIAAPQELESHNRRLHFDMARKFNA